MLLRKQAELDAHTRMFARKRIQPCQPEFCSLSELAWGKAALMSSSLPLFNLHALGVWYFSMAVVSGSHPDTDQKLINTILVSRVLTRKNPWC